MDKITWTVVSLGAKYAGACESCGRRIDGYHLGDALLLSREVDSKTKYGVAHAACCGVSTKGAVSGGRKSRGPLPETVDL